MPDTRKLRWVHRNRAESSPTRRAADLLAGLARDVDASCCVARDLASAVSPLVDGQFRRHCRIAGMSGRGVVFSVDRPSLVYPLKQRWAAVLQRSLERALRGRRVSQIIFQFGVNGVEVGDPPAGEAAGHAAVSKSRERPRP